MKSVLFGLAASLAAPVSGTFVVQCYSRLFDQRADPVVSPGVASSHVHTIAGGNGFDFSMTYDDARASQCSTCNIKQDLSNYWTPKLYFKAQNGSFINVPIIGDNQYGNLGGMAIYYLPRAGPDNDKLHAFKPGFRMLAGDASKRVETDDFAGRAVSHKCVGGNGPDTKHLPNEKCDQIRVQVTFPSCWDGKNLDSEDHKSHVSYPKDGNYDGGRCPDTHPVHLATLFYEVYYDTKGFKDQWYSDQQPFVFSSGDATGYGYHGDFVNGWNEAALQKALDTCNDGVPNCAETVFGEFNSQDETQKCRLPPKINEQVNGVLDALPGCNLVTTGPNQVTMKQGCNAPKVQGGSAPQSSTASQPVATPQTTAKIQATATPQSTATPQKSGYTDVTSKGYKYIGCGKDNPIHRTLAEGLSVGSDITVEKCVTFCKGKGKKYAGLEFSGQCYCGSAVAADRAPGTSTNCVMKCTGNANQVCGGADALSLYEACSGGACTNAVKRESRRLARLELANAKAAM